MGINLGGLGSGITDTYSTLLGGGGSGSSDMSTLLSDYASIKNGSYGKMMKSYYAKVDEEDETSSSKSKSKTKETDGASASAARKFYETASGMSALDYSADNIDKLYDSVSAFVKDYNAMMTNASKSKNAAVKAQADALNDYTYQNYKLFSKVGITMNADRTLSIDEDTFKKVNEKTGATTVPTLTTLFKGIGSFADKAADRASKIYREAGEGESVTSSKAKYAGTTGSVSADSTTESTSSGKGTSKTAKDAASAKLASTLYKSIEKLGTAVNGNESKDNIFDALSGFVKDYNDLIKKSSESENSNVIKQTDYLKDLISGNKSAFSRMGITVNSDKSLTIDEEKFMEADMNALKDMFNGAYSFGEKMTDRINQIYRYATQGETLSGQAYTSQGAYSAVGTGSTLDTTM
ncbi:MAG: hypothetical protein HDR28_07545 [Lachnospiraceae bacterium]|nr:hypothetical protein [Lachnospiraceae bacterium]